MSILVVWIELWTRPTMKNLNVFLNLVARIQNGILDDNTILAWELDWYKHMDNQWFISDSSPVIFSIHWRDNYSLWQWTTQRLIKKNLNREIDHLHRLPHIPSRTCLGWFLISKLSHKEFWLNTYPTIYLSNTNSINAIFNICFFLQKP